ncbi:hypothetical protein HA052_23235, partial [Chromobacterium haemolyticum]
MLTPDLLATLRTAAEAAHRPDVFWYKQDLLEEFTGQFTGPAADVAADAAYIAEANPGRVLALLDRIAELEQYAARYRALRRGQRWSVVNGIGDTLRAEKLDAAIDATMEPPRCTCPSGDGSLRWPCPR